MRVRMAMLVFLGALTPGLVRADVKPHALCSEGMVLQQKAKVKIWGTADKGEKVTVTFRDQNATDEAGDKGDWLVTLDSGNAGGPLPMTISGKNKIEYKDVLVGEVWVCSGQSNMEMSVGGCDNSDKETAKNTGVVPTLRMFTVKKNPQPDPVKDVEGSWVIAKPETVGGFSAVGFFFGRDLRNALGVPVGMIHTSWGGTRAEAWTSRPVLDAHPLYKSEHERMDKQLEKYRKDPEGLLKEQQEAARKAKKPEPRTVQIPIQANSPSALYDGMIAPILNYTIKGAIWYQGESNAGQAYNYRTLFPLMIKNWRDDWKVGDFPFLFVQLAPFQAVAKEPGESNWAELREAQLLTLKLPNTGMAVITDFGNVQDIHPAPKQPVGERLALIARANTYGEKIEYSGPMFKEMKVEGNKAVLHFTHVGKGLTGMELAATEIIKGANKQTAYRVKAGSASTEIQGFTVCGEDHKFHPAKAEIVGDTVVVQCDAVAKPVAVRYGWAIHPVCNLYNKDGLPASPFRTDDFPGVTAPKKG